jgi:glutamyl/glutaminyl-tRNA synthetase
MCRQAICITVGIFFLAAIVQLNREGRLSAADASQSKEAAVKKTNDGNSGSSSAQTDREKIWNSPEMLRARAWLEEYFRVTKKYTPEQKQEYRQHLEAMTGPQMEMWLMRFQQDRNMAQGQERAEDQSRNAALARGKAYRQQQQKSLNDINAGENKAAAREEKTLNQEQQFARSMYKQKQEESTAMLMEYSSGGFGWGFGMGF